ncbi:uncharacterized protein LOC116853663 [Odontomachus brunneus]|uniref:uncharacterized protein LOC116853663 n=1 Tax=Odontomachus brunneus TaxID=486640 RepID=UPI0013F1AFEC|nr:uncharacterized protein LOC116853663 [Odontomachus brunneus]
MSVTPQIKRLGHSANRRRWAVSKMDTDIFKAALAVATWRIDAIDRRTVAGKMEWLRGIMTDACNASMPRVTPLQRRTAYWWTSKIAQLREIATAARRRLSRARRRHNGGLPGIELIYHQYRGARKALTTEIARQMERSHRELLEGLNRDPWGRPYKMVMNKLRAWAPPLTESMDPETVELILDALFPRGTVLPPLGIGSVGELGASPREDVRVTREELRMALRRMRTQKAPGPDGPGVEGGIPRNGGHSR